MLIVTYSFGAPGRSAQNQGKKHRKRSHFEKPHPESDRAGSIGSHVGCFFTKLQKVLKNDSQSDSFWSHFGCEVRHTLPCGRPGVQTGRKQRGVKKKRKKVERRGGRCAPGASGNVRKFRVSGSGSPNPKPQRIHRPNMDPLTLHFVPWGHGGGYIYIYIYMVWFSNDHEGGS